MNEDPGIQTELRFVGDCSGSEFGGCFEIIPTLQAGLSNSITAESLDLQQPSPVNFCPS
jgi:hypothetical protein